jgi:hypothetical protein
VRYHIKSLEYVSGHGMHRMNFVFKIAASVRFDRPELYEAAAEVT